MSPSEQETVERRSANYAPSIWTDQFIQSQTTKYLDEEHVERARELKERVRGLLVKKKDTSLLLLDQLELIDVLERLGLSHHFDHEIHGILSALHEEYRQHNNNGYDNHMSMYQTSLLFRLLRQHGFPISQEIFKSFMKEGEGSFEERHSKDPKGLLSLYEASYLSIEDEEIMDKAKVFSTHHLNKYLNHNNNNNDDDEDDDGDQKDEVRHALEMPLHWRMKRLESRRFIDVYEKRLETKRKTKKEEEEVIPCEEEEVIMELAVLDFNMMQAIYLKELKEVSRWHEDIGLAEGMGTSYARSRVAESFLWSVGFVEQPQYEYCRNIISKIVEFITVIDDVYDVYATLREAQTLTHAITRWDVNGIEEMELPRCVKVCLLALFNYVNLIVYDVLKEHGINVLPYLKHAWVGIVEAYLREAKWYHNREKPSSLEEYLNNGLVSIGVPLILMEAYIAMASKNKKRDAKSVPEEAHLKILVETPEIIRYSAIISRLSDDLGTSSDEMERGDVPKAVQCRMSDMPGCGEEEARGFIRGLVEENWKKMNGRALAELSRFPRDFITTVMNLPRTGLAFYQHGDGHGHPEGTTKHRVHSLFFQPFATTINN